MKSFLFVILTFIFTFLSAQDTIQCGMHSSIFGFSKPIFSCNTVINSWDSTAQKCNVECATHLVKAAVPCPGSCNRINTFTSEINIHSQLGHIKRLFDSANRMAQTYFYNSAGNNIIEYFENGTSIICRFGGDSGVWYGQMSAESTIKEAWNMKPTDSLNQNNSELVMPPFLPGYSILPSGIWTYKNYSGILLLRHFRIAYVATMKAGEWSLELEEL